MLFVHDLATNWLISMRFICYPTFVYKVIHKKCEIKSFYMKRQNAPFLGKEIGGPLIHLPHIKAGRGKIMPQIEPPKRALYNGCRIAAFLAGAHDSSDHVILFDTLDCFPLFIVVPHLKKSGPGIGKGQSAEDKPPLLPRVTSEQAE